MEPQSAHAVLTGDIIESSKLEKNHRKKLPHILEEIFTAADELSQARSGPGFQIFRGDSFQGIFSMPEVSLDAVLLIRAMLRTRTEREFGKTMDCRVAVGIGEIDFMPGSGGEGDGEAFRLSGLHLDRFKKDRSLGIVTGQPGINNELEAECLLAEVIISKWTANQAEVIPMLISGKTQLEIASELNIAQSSVSYRVRDAGWRGIDGFRKRYREIINLNF